MKNKRREFLKNVCPTVALAFFGVTMLEACSSGVEDETIGGGNGSGSGNSGNSNNGYTVNGNTITITLSHSTFSSLNSNGWMNFTAQNMLLLKIDSIESNGNEKIRELRKKLIVSINSILDVK